MGLGSIRSGPFTGEPGRFGSESGQRRASPGRNTSSAVRASRRRGESRQGPGRVDGHGRSAGNRCGRPRSPRPIRREPAYDGETEPFTLCRTNPGTTRGSVTREGGNVPCPTVPTRPRTVPGIGWNPFGLVGDVLLRRGLLPVTFRTPSGMWNISWWSSRRTDRSTSTLGVSPGQTDFPIPMRTAFHPTGKENPA